MQDQIFTTYNNKNISVSSLKEVAMKKMNANNEIAKFDVNSKMSILNKDFLLAQVKEELKKVYKLKKEHWESDQILKSEVDLLAEELLKYFSSYTIAFCFQHINQGIRAQYGAFTRITVAQCHAWIKIGLRQIEEAKNKAYSPPLAKNDYPINQKTPSVQEQEIIIFNHVKNKFIDFLKSDMEIFKDDFWICYKYFLKNESIKSMAWKSYKNRVKIINNRENVPNSVLKIRQVLFEAPDLETECKRLLIMDYFIKNQLELKKHFKI